MRVSWASGQATLQYLKWGFQTNSYPFINQSQPFTYKSDQLCGPPATTYGWRDPGTLHTVVITDLQPMTSVYYIVGSDATGWSEEFSFNSPIIPSPQNGVKLIAYGDLGKGEMDGSLEHWEEVPSLNTTKNVLAKVNNEGFDLVLHIGDIAYAVGYSAQWDEFMNQMAPVAAQVPYMTLPGNHERDFPKSGSLFNSTDSGGECGIPYETRFLMPGTTHEEQWYSFDYGNIHFIMMSTELNFTEGSPQHQFIMEDLQNVDRTTTPWVIFAGHRPMYIDSMNVMLIYGDQPVASILRESLEELIVKYEVDLALWGHHHSYQRSCPLFNGTCYEGQQFPVHVVIGMAGMRLTANFAPLPPSWLMEADDAEFGFSTIETTESSLHMQFFNNNNQLRDSFFLTK